LRNFGEVFKNAVVGQEVEPGAENLEVGVGIFNQCLDYAGEALVSDPVVPDFQELQSGMVGYDVFCDGLGSVVADFVVEDVQVF
jgi:hypothetical protein